MAVFIDPEVIHRVRKVKNKMLDQADEIERYWKSIAPVFGKTGHDERRAAPRYGQPGDYRDSIHVVVKEGYDGRTLVRVQTKDFKRFWIEYGSAHMPEYAPRAKTVKKFRR